MILVGPILSHPFNLLSSSKLTTTVGLAMGLVTVTGIMMLMSSLLPAISKQDAFHRIRYFRQHTVFAKKTNETLLTGEDTLTKFICDSLEPQLPLPPSSGAKLYISVQ